MKIRTFIPPRRLIVNADDFGRSTSINTAVIRAHREGILTSASLMVAEPAVAEAVALARENPRMGVGLHLTLGLGLSALPHEKIPGLVNPAGEFDSNPVSIGFRYFACPSLKEQLRQEIEAQFKRFRDTGLPLDHVNGHCHLHLQPVVFKLLMENATQWGIRHFRLTRESFWINARAASGAWVSRAVHAIIFHIVGAWCGRALKRRGILHTQMVFGQLQNARVDEDYVLKLLPLLPAGDSELYSHPSLVEFKNEFDAVMSPRVAAKVAAQNIQLIRYQDL